MGAAGPDASGPRLLRRDPPGPGPPAALTMAAPAPGPGPRPRPRALAIAGPSSRRAPARRTASGRAAKPPPAVVKRRGAGREPRTPPRGRRGGRARRGREGPGGSRQGPVPEEREEERKKKKEKCPRLGRGAAGALRWCAGSEARRWHRWVSGREELRERSALGRGGGGCKGNGARCCGVRNGMAQIFLVQSLLTRQIRGFFSEKAVFLPSHFSWFLV